jgi:hypothetical protein
MSDTSRERLNQRRAYGEAVSDVAFARRGGKRLTLAGSG